MEYGDFECPHCGALHPVIQAARKAFGGNLRFVFRHFPLRSSHPHALAAAKAAEAAGEQGRFWEMHDRLYRRQTAAGATRTCVRHARELGLDVAALRAGAGGADARGPDPRGPGERGARAARAGRPRSSSTASSYQGSLDRDEVFAALARAAVAAIP